MPKIMASAPNAGGRHQRGRRIGPTLSEINVIPLVDVMLVLLIIFMVAAPMMQRGVEVNLPVSTRAPEISKNEPVYLTVPETFRTEGRVFLDDEPIRMEFLAERIRQTFEGRTDKQVFLRGDGGVQYQDLMTVFDALKTAGIDQVGLVTRLPGER
jgi:biopolymer transport protein TolR